MGDASSKVTAAGGASARPRRGPWSPPTWVRAGAVIGTAYFLVATSKLPDDSRAPTICPEGTPTGPVAATLRDPVATVVGDGCAGYDGLVEGAIVDLVLAPVTLETAPACTAYEAELVALPPAAGELAVVEQWSGSSGSGLLTFGLELERPDEPGCRFSSVITVAPRDELTADAANEVHYDVAVTPLVLTRTLSFPQVHLCAGAAGEAARGEWTCSDAWNVTLESS